VQHGETAQPHDRRQQGSGDAVVGAAERLDREPGGGEQRCADTRTLVDLEDPQQQQRESEDGLHVEVREVVDLMVGVGHGDRRDEGGAGVPPEPPGEKEQRVAGGQQRQQRS
jgi:hypothetical protein